MGLPEIGSIIATFFMNLRFSDDFELSIFFRFFLDFFQGLGGNQAYGLVTIFVMFHMRPCYPRF